MLLLVFVSHIWILRIKRFGSFLMMVIFRLKTATWANNDFIAPHGKTKFLNSIWSLKLTPKLKFFVWQLSRDKSRRIGLNIDVDCPFCQPYMKNMDHLCKDCNFAINIWITINFKLILIMGYWLAWTYLESEKQLL